MSHHFDLIHPDETGGPGDESPAAKARRAMDISDVHCFAGPSDDDGPRTVIGMNASPQFFTADSDPWNPPTGPEATMYELKLDLNDDFVEDITWRFTFSEPDPSTGTQYVQVAQLNGKDATNRDAPGTIITPPNASVEEVLCVGDGIKIFAGKRLDSFFTDLRVPQAMRNVLPPPMGKSAIPDLPVNQFTNNFMGQSVRLIMVELPAGITGLDPIQCWGSTAILDTSQTPPEWVQVQRAAGGNVAVVFGNGQDPYHTLINGRGPSHDLQGRPANPTTHPATGVWGAVRDQTAAVVEAMGTYDQGVNGQPTPVAYGAFVADTLLPDVLRFTPGTTAKWDPWRGIRNGKGLFEVTPDNLASMVTNTDFSTGLTQQEPLHPYFPYLLPDS
jgi:hypothetical protein